MKPLPKLKEENITTPETPPEPPSLYEILQLPASLRAACENCLATSAHPSEGLIGDAEKTTDVRAKALLDSVVASRDPSSGQTYSALKAHLETTRGAAQKRR